MTDVSPGAWLAHLFVCGASVALCSSAHGAGLYTDRVLPREGEPFRIVYRTARSDGPREVSFRVLRVGGGGLADGTIPLAAADGAFEAALPLEADHNGLFRAEATCGQDRQSLTIAVISPKREVHLIYFGLGRNLLDEGLVRWVTLVTAAGADDVPALRRRGITPLAWNWGSNCLGDKAKELAQAGGSMTPEVAQDIGRTMYVAPAAEAVAGGYAGFGLDEFGGYAASDFLAQTKGFVRGMIEARPELPDGFVMAAWHGGPIDTELMGLYKQAVEFLLPEAYLLEIVPAQLGTELIREDLAGRLAAARANDMFTAPYGSRCRVIPSVDATDTIAIGEYEVFVRMLRREFPEARGIAFFNVLDAKRENYRVLDSLCYDYFIKPVLTFEPDSLYFDRYGSGKVTAALSNIGAMDSGPAAVRLCVDDQPVAGARIASVPAGFSRVDNRAFAVFPWEPTHAGVHRLRVELVRAAGATVLEPASEANVFLEPR